MDYLKAFLIGGIICAIGQILIDKTKLTPARILVSFVVACTSRSSNGRVQALPSLLWASVTCLPTELSKPFGKSDCSVR